MLLMVDVSPSFIVGITGISMKRPISALNFVPKCEVPVELKACYHESMDMAYQVKQNHFRFAFLQMLLVVMAICHEVHFEFKNMFN